MSRSPYYFCFPCQLAQSWPHYKNGHLMVPSCRCGEKMQLITEGGDPLPKPAITLTEREYASLQLRLKEQDERLAAIREAIARAFPSQDYIEKYASERAGFFIEMQVIISVWTAIKGKELAI
jgi:hypothetical protein